jgi:ubiquinone/menaquinone biosynthesis C-methylase UbiE
MVSWQPVASKLLFGLGAGIYDWITAQPTWREHSASLAEQFPSPAAGRATRILDLGAGPGVSGLAMLERRPDARVTGVDISAQMLRRALRQARRAGAPFDLARADATRLPFADGAFDAAAGHSFLYLVADRGAVLEEVRRVLAPEGALVLLEPNRRGHTATIPFMRGELRFKASMTAWRVVSAGFGQFDRGQLAGLMESHGFVDVRVEETLGDLGLLASARRQA